MLFNIFRLTRNVLRSIYRSTTPTFWKIAAFLTSLLLLEVYIHVRNHAVPRPSKPLDAPFYTGCQSPILNTTTRASAVLVMLARNSEVTGAIASVRSVQEQFNDNFGYPWVFLNDQPWSEEFIERVSEAVGERGGNVKFEQIPEEMWGYPAWIDQDKARRKMEKMEREGIQYGGSESYRHMCRFQSGFFFNHPSLLPYKFYWRVEPNIAFTCALTYDPFLSMQSQNKRYGYNIALWERGQTVASLFRKLSDYKNHHYPQQSTSPLWTAMIDASYLPWPFRPALAFLRNRNEKGDLWNMCHFWSNFEIADMEFFRSEPYRHLFDFLDRDGGFYYERWGDAPVHSLAAAMLLKPEELHHFSDLGYVHDGLQYCAYQSTEEEKGRGFMVPPTTGVDGMERREEVGCRCKCDPSARVVEPVCMNRIGLALS